MTLAMKELPDVDMEKFERLLSEVNMSMNRREEKLKELYDKIEAGLVLLGATAVEDKLQDGVEDTLRSLSLAGIRVWILTGYLFLRTLEEVALAVLHCVDQ